MKTPETLNFQLGNITIEPEYKVKLLGIDIDSKLNFNCHIHEICEKAARQINALKRQSKFLTFESRMAIFRSFIMSNVIYCSLVWHAYGVQNTRKLEKLQERALRFVYLDKVSSYDDLLTKANLTTLHLGRLNMLATEVYKSVHILNCLAVWCRLPLSCAHPCLSARVHSFKLSSVSLMQHPTS